MVLEVRAVAAAATRERRGFGPRHPPTLASAVSPFQRWSWLASSVRLVSWLAAVSSTVPTIGCADPERIAEPPLVDRARFETEVYPVLLRDCAFPACHGATDRFFRVHGPGRTRLSSTSLPYDPPTSDELAFSFDRARSMLAAVPDPAQSLLLRKPLETAAGGSAHAGRDALGRNVYASTDDPSWQAIASWAGAPIAGPDAGPTFDATSSEDTVSPTFPDASLATDAASEDAP